MAKTPAQLDREIAEVLAGKTPQRAHATIAGARAAKTKLIHVVQGNYGYGHGWEDLTAEDTRKEALARLREYRENERGVPFRLIRRRERIAATSASVHARKKKIDHGEAKRLLEAEGIDFSGDYHANVSASQAGRIAEVAKQAGYRKRKDAPGSTARMYFQYLGRLRHHATRGKHTVYDLVEVNTRTKKERVLHEHFSKKAHAKEAADQYKEHKRPDVTYRVRSRQVPVPPYRWNPED